MILRTDYVAVHDAWRYFRKDKKPSQAIYEFAYHLEENVAKLSRELGRESYRHGNYQPVVLHEKKRRDLAVATVRDRVVHRLLYDYLVDIFDKSFDPDVWSSRKGKGLHACLGRTKKLLQKYQKSFVWRADITRFFDHIDHQVLLEALTRKIAADKKALWLCQQVINSYTINRTGQDRTGQDRTGQDRTGQAYLLAT